MPLRNLRLQQRLMAIMLVTSACVLVMTCAGFFAYEFLTFRQSMVRQLSTVAAIVADNSTAVLAFEDRKGAEEILSALKAERHIAEAGLYDGEGRLFSTYPKDADPGEFPPAPAAEGFRFGGGYLQGFQAVVQNDKRLGTLYVKSDLKAVTARFQLYGAVVVLVSGLAFLLAYLLSRALQRQISGPILALADTARAVSDRRDYSVRARQAGTGELGLLTDAFNQMLTQIQGQLTRMELLNQITRAISERLDLTSVFQVMLGALEENLAVDFICVCRYDADARLLTVTSVGAKAAPLAEELGMTANARIPIDDGLRQCVGGQFTYEPDITNLRHTFTDRLADKGLRSMALSPLLVDSGVFGILIAARKVPDGISRMDREFLRQLSDHGALAAHQAHLYGALQQAYEDLRRSQQAVMEQERLRALGQMASGIAHDINNAISPAALYTESILERETNLSTQSREHLQTIAHAIEDVAATVARMREFSRQREPNANSVPVQVNKSIQQVIDLTRSRWHDTPQQRGIVIKIKTELDPGLPPVMGVEGEIREALTNLFLNAFDSMPEGGTLTLRTRKGKDKDVIAEVSDTGAGMDEETRRRCLEPFYTTKGERGTGLGLAMVYGVAERHGAELQIDSAPGKGTTMRIVFPEAEEAIAERQAPEAPAAPLRLRILVVDDDPLVAKVLRETMKMDGHEVATANGGQAGIDTYLTARKSGAPFDLVMTDLGMPYVDGRKVAAAVKAASSATPVILLTGWGQSLLEDGDMPPHVDKLLSKPPKMADLREALASLAPKKTAGGIPA
ncbi:MAG: hybrid sensor histidine kinase/response regulator [Fibrobacteres bacterium]|nr:hybrid sensor histidine kinase/response regulator [Fibrobacterota bacterium]